MRNLLCSAAALLLACSLPAEVIESVTFNPSRLGRYENLRITDELTTPGGIFVSGNMNVNSGGTVIMKGTEEYEITNIEAKRAKSISSSITVNNVYMHGGKASFDLDSIIKELNDEAAKVKTSDADISGYIVINNSFKLGDNPIPNWSGNCDDGELSWVELKTDSGVFKVLGLRGC